MRLFVLRKERREKKKKKESARRHATRRRRDPEVILRSLSAVRYVLSAELSLYIDIRAGQAAAPYKVGGPHVNSLFHYNTVSRVRYRSIN